MPAAAEALLVDVADMVFLTEKALPDDALILPSQNFANADLDKMSMSTRTTSTRFSI